MIAVDKDPCPELHDGVEDLDFDKAPESHSIWARRDADPSQVPRCIWLAPHHRVGCQGFFFVFGQKTGRGLGGFNCPRDADRRATNGRTHGPTSDERATNGRTHGPTNDERRADGLTAGLTAVRLDEWTGGRVDRWADGWTSGRLDGLSGESDGSDMLLSGAQRRRARRRRARRRRGGATSVA